MSARDAPPPAVGRALGALAGAVLVLDADLRVLTVSPEAAALLGHTPAPGRSAVAVLCGDTPERPVAEALSAGRPVDAVIPHPAALSGRTLRVRARPLEGAGWVLLLEEGDADGDDAPVCFHGMWTQDPAMKAVFRVLSRVAVEDVSVLVRGETGAGKELAARALHDLSPRKDGPFRAINCAALPPNLLESELFGHVRGAFTGAVKDNPGHFQLAHRGTLFLDEVAELPLELQAKLLRVVETRHVLPVGGREPVPVDVRIVSATHRALRAEVAAGRFRADLMFRLRVVPVFLPPLRERREDIPLLVRRYVEDMNGKARRRIEHIAPATLALLSSYDYPGNVRELRNFLAYAYAVGTGPVLLPSDLPPEIVEPRHSDRPELAETVPAHAPRPSVETAAPAESPEARRIRDALSRTRNSKTRAAQLLGISRVTLWRRMVALGIATH
jgi:two-component system response regulator AtoC